MNLRNIIQRKKSLFQEDLQNFEKDLQEIIQSSKFLVLGAAGSIGQAVTKEIFKRQPQTLHVVDISENNLAELVRDIRSSFGYIKGDFSTYALDIGSSIFKSFFQHQKDYDYILNLTALKHVRSEKDPFTLMRLIQVNVTNTLLTLNLSNPTTLKKYFCVSTDKAAAPVNIMGASKYMMERFLMRESERLTISTARFANVIFSDGSLPFSFSQRLQKQQPIVAPYDIKRYFVTQEESGLLCLFSCLFGENRDIFFPKLDHSHLLTFKTIAENFLHEMGYDIDECSSEEEARQKAQNLKSSKSWPCLWTKSDTSGEKDIEEFFTPNEVIDHSTFKSLGVIKNQASSIDLNKLSAFENKLEDLLQQNIWNRQDLIALFKETCPEFNHLDTGKFLDQKM